MKLLCLRLKQAFCRGEGKLNLKVVCSHCIIISQGSSGSSTFFVSHESPYFSHYNPKISASNSLYFGSYSTGVSQPFFMEGQRKFKKKICSMAKWTPLSDELSLYISMYSRGDQRAKLNWSAAGFVENPCYSRKCTYFRYTNFDFLMYFHNSLISPVSHTYFCPRRENKKVTLR